MKYEDFIARVQEQANLGSLEDAQQITEAALETLGERLYRTEREHLAAQLPKELQAYLMKRQEPQPTTRQQTDRYTIQEFYNRVGARAGTGYSDAARYARVVFSVLGQAVSPGVLEQVLKELPGEYSQLSSLD